MKFSIERHGAFNYYHTVSLISVGGSTTTNMAAWCVARILLAISLLSIDSRPAGGTLREANCIYIYICTYICITELGMREFMG